MRFLIEIVFIFKAQDRIIKKKHTLTLEVIPYEIYETRRRRSSIYSGPGGLFPIREEIHGMTILYKHHPCRPCTLQNISYNIKKKQ